MQRSYGIRTLRTSSNFQESGFVLRAIHPGRPPVYQTKLKQLGGIQQIEIGASSLKASFLVRGKPKGNPPFLGGSSEKMEKTKYSQHDLCPNNSCSGPPMLSLSVDRSGAGHVWVQRVCSGLREMNGAEKMCLQTSRGTFHFHSFQGSFFLENLRKPRENGR